MNRRDWLRLGATGLVAGFGGQSLLRPASAQTIPQKAKRVVILFQGGGPSQLETFDPKPGLAELRNTELPDSVQQGRRITTMTSGRGALRVANSLLSFQQYGQSGMWASEAVPYLGGIADDLCLINSTYAEAVNHDPATNLALTGNQLQGKPSIGAWISYALGVANANLPSFVTMISQSAVQFVQPLSKRLWSSVFLPVTHQGVALRPGDSPVLYLDDGLGLSQSDSGKLFQAVRGLNELHFKDTGDPDIPQRNLAYDVALAMESSMVELADVSKEPDEVFDLYGPNSRVAGSYAANCLRARRLLERDVRCVMLLHRGWDHHYNVTKETRIAGGDVDQPTAALITDLKRTGLLDDTLVVWGGEFGRTCYSQGDITDTDHGRDHHPYCFTTLLAGAGVKPGLTYGATDDFAYNVVENGVHIHDLHATILYLCGVDHTQLTFRSDGRDQRLTDISGEVVRDILA
ncbi:MAG TPA: DUF1501 domain-containing protein [Polyangiaceae bacterium]|jgi:hypothetical protein|nr:DUF1501 domain-containing protein [Polyangiaceae bacterium]